MSNMTPPQHHGHHPDDHPGDQGHHGTHNGQTHDDAGHGTIGSGAIGQHHPTPSDVGHGTQGHAASAGAGGRAHAASHHGRDKIDWSREVWSRIDAAVREEITRARVAAKFLPTIHVPAKATTVPADIVSPTSSEDKTPINALSVDETATTRINEYWVEFSLTPAQVEEEMAAVHDPHHPQQQKLPEHGHGHHHQHQHHPPGHASTGTTLATRAANILAQVEDSIIFQGQNFFQSQLMSGASSPVNFRVNQPTLDLGLLNLLLPTSTLANPALALSADQIVTVSPAQPSGAQSGLYQEKTVAAVAQAFSNLQGKGQYGPYALVLQTAPFADAHSPLPTTLITPAEPIRHLMNAGFYGTGTLPPFKTIAGTAGGGLNGGLGTTTSITAVKVTAPGTGYTTAGTTVTIAAPPAGGTQALATAIVSGGAITGIAITVGGSGYTSAPLVTIVGPAGALGAAAVVPQILYTGIVVSLGGNTMDLVRGKMSHEEDVIVRFEQKDVDGNYRFRVVERFALRLKDITAVVQLQFLSA
jgi:uncharacterized linocin/CFP29 family protein